MGNEVEKRGELRAEERLMEAAASQVGPPGAMTKVRNGAVCHRRETAEKPPVTACQAPRWPRQPAELWDSYSKSRWRPMLLEACWCHRKRAVL